MKPQDEENRVQARALMPQALPQLVERNGPAVIDDLRRYLLMCLKAKELRNCGFRAQVRGHWQHWLVVIEQTVQPQKGERFSTPLARHSRTFMRHGQVHIASFRQRIPDSQ
jgi:hypothetical protein